MFSNRRKNNDTRSFAIRKKLTNPDLVLRRLVLASRAIMARQRALPVILGGSQGVPKASTRVGLVGLGSFYAGIGTMNLVLGTLCVHLTIMS